jgi:2-phospho-L-lactate guanylyltransferase
VATLAERMLAVAAAFPGLCRTAVVSACDDVLGLVESAGAWGIREVARDRDAGAGRAGGSGGRSRRESESDGAGGPGGAGSLDAALALGVRTLRAAGAGAIIIAAGDLPLLRSDDLIGLARLGSRTGAVVVCPDRHRSGTNALYLPPGARLRFQFGPRSGLAHRREARRAGLAALVHGNPRIAFDVDTPEDYAHWLQAAGGQVALSA